MIEEATLVACTSLGTIESDQAYEPDDEITLLEEFPPLGVDPAALDSDGTFDDALALGIFVL